jgi:hypothetical protein
MGRGEEGGRWKEERDGVGFVCGAWCAWSFSSVEYLFFFSGFASHNLLSAADQMHENQVLGIRGREDS